MRYLGWIVGLGLAISAGAQTMTEFGAAAAGGTAGGAAGKKVSDGITAIFGKVDNQTKAAAKAAKEDPAKADKPAAPAATIASTAIAPTATSALTATSSSPAPASKPAPAKRAVSAKAASLRSKRAEPPSVPDPPALPTHAAAASKGPEPPQHPRPVVEVAPVVPPPPPPEVTAENLKDIAPGAAREDVLKLGIPATRITMFGDDGHLLEIYSYRTKNTIFGVVRLSDGAVSKVELR